MNEWQPIETAPKDGTQFLGWDQGYFIVVYWEIDDDVEEDQCWRISYSGDLMFPTHWMPLPEPPK